jgi:predicted nuclease of predicted toxin-antitoxin system
MRVKIIVDVNLAIRWVKMLSERGVEAVHWTEIGAANAPDTEIIAYARQNGYSIFTNDLDFSALLVFAQASGPSIIQIRAEDTRPEALVDHAAQIFIQFRTEIEQGSLITIDPKKTRLHILPFILEDWNNEENK